MPRLRLWLMYQVNFGTEARGGLWRCSDAKKRGQECRGATAIRRWESGRVYCWRWYAGLWVLPLGVGSRSVPGWYPWGSGVKTMASLRPLSLRCIFYKGAVAGAGFHLLLSVCLGLRRCWISVFGNVIAPLGSPM